MQDGALSTRRSIRGIRRLDLPTDHTIPLPGSSPKEEGILFPSNQNVPLPSDSGDNILEELQKVDISADSDILCITCIPYVHLHICYLFVCTDHKRVPIVIQ